MLFLFYMLLMKKTVHSSAMSHYNGPYMYKHYQTASILNKFSAFEEFTPAKITIPYNCRYFESGTRYAGVRWPGPEPPDVPAYEG